MKNLLQTVLLVYVLVFFINNSFGIDDFETWKNKEKDAFQNYRSKQDEEFANFLKENWQKFELSKSAIIDEEPKPDNIPTVTAEKIKPKKIQDKTRIENVPLPVLIPEIDEIDIDNSMEVYQPQKGNQLEINFWGLPLIFAIEKLPEIKMKQPLDKKAIADFWYQTGNYNFDPIIEQLQQKKDKLSLNDWDYCKLINEFSTKLSADGKTLKRLYNWYFLVKSGYDVKVGYNKESVNLLISSNMRIYGVTYLTIEERKYYLVSFDNKKVIEGGIYTYDKKYPNSDDLLDLSISKIPRIPEKIISKDLSFKYGREKYVITIDFDESTARFFNDYPQTELSVYFKAPLSNKTEYSLIKQFKPILEGKSQTEAVNVLLRFVQTAFAYQTDNQQFGREKTLTTVETLYYPFSDCEDRSVIFSYLVQTLLHLDVIALDYPGHIATAVKFNNEVSGDVIIYDNQRYLICDPTYINAEIGMTMPKFRKVNPEIFTF